MSPAHLLTQALLCILVVGKIHGWESRFEFSGELYCSKPQFRSHIVAWKDDSLFDDAISSNLVEYSTAPHRYFAKATDTGDGNNRYEVYFQVFHTCIRSGETKVFYENVGLFEVKDGLNQSTHHFSVENLGEYDPRILGHVDIN